MHRARGLAQEARRTPYFSLLHGWVCLFVPDLPFHGYNLAIVATTTPDKRGGGWLYGILRPDAAIPND